MSPRVKAVALWVAVGGVLGATRCQWPRPARSAAAQILWDGPLPVRPDVAPGRVVHVPHRSAVHHVIGI